MPPFSHGSVASLGQVEAATKRFHAIAATSTDTPEPPPTLTRFGYLFPELQENPMNLLPEAPATVANLILLASTMRDDGADLTRNSGIPSVYTYFAQFVDHDITLEAATQGVRLWDLDLRVLQLQEILKLKNTRTPGFDLDTVYGPAQTEGSNYPIPRNGDLMVVARAADSKIAGTDLPRDPHRPHAAQIGDQRNDSHLMVSQIHLAFLRAHNAILARYPSFNFEQARKTLRQHYQWIVIEDFLTRVVDTTILQQILDGTLNIFDPPDDDFFMPLEFTVAAYRFGHSMVRHIYDYNPTFPSAKLGDLLLMPGQLATYPHIRDVWIIDWTRFVQDGANLARMIDTSLVEPLASLPGPIERPLSFSLAVRDLLRGYVLRMPTGQAVARALGCQVMTATEIEAVATSAEQKQILRDPNTNFSSRTPLWFYILAEAAHDKGGLRLGPVGSSIVAAVLVGLVRRSKDSYLRIKGWRPDPTFGKTPGQFNLADLFRLAGVL